MMYFDADELDTILLVKETDCGGKKGIVRIGYSVGKFIANVLGIPVITFGGCEDTRTLCEREVREGRATKEWLEV